METGTFPVWVLSDKDKAMVFPRRSEEGNGGVTGSGASICCKVGSDGIELDEWPGSDDEVDVGFREVAL
jgi:hypothetical protein